MNIEAAREDVRRELGLTGSLLEEGREDILREMAFWAARRSDPDHLVNEARTNPVAFEACVTLLDECVQAGAPPPDNLLRLAIDVMRGEVDRPGVPGRSGLSNFSRNLEIIHLVRIAMSHGLPKYTDSEDHPSACKVVRDCLDEYGVPMSFSAVRTIIKSYKRWG